MVEEMVPAAEKGLHNAPKMDKKENVYKGRDKQTNLSLFTKLPFLF